MFGSGKIISSSQMKTTKMKNSAFMKDLMKKGGSELLRKDFDKKQFWNAMRNESKTRKFGERGYTKKTLTEFFAKQLNNKSDGLTDKKIKKLAELAGVKSGALINKAAEIKQADSKNKIIAKREEKAIKSDSTQFIKSVSSRFSGHSNGVSANSGGFSNTVSFAGSAEKEDFRPQLRSQKQAINYLKKEKEERSAPQVQIRFGTATFDHVNATDEVPASAARLFGRTQKSVEEAERAKKLIASINDSEDYENEKAA